jgi:1-phosphofructokinase
VPGYSPVVDDEGTIMVFAPVPQLTVTIEQQGEAPELHVHPGGQGIRQARMCAALGASVTPFARLPAARSEPLSRHC